jgi:hypothetical protein
MKQVKTLVERLKEAGGWDSMDAKSKAFAEGMDAMLKEYSLDKVDKTAVDTAIEEKLKGALSETEKKEMIDTVESVRKMATEIQKLKDAGFKAEEVLPFSRAFMKAYEAKKEEIVAIKGKQNGSVEFSFKAATTMGTGNITANTAPTMPGTTVEMGLAATPRNQPFLLEFVDTGSVSTPNVMWFNKVNRENGTAFIAEGVIKPLSDFDIVGETSTVKKVATAFNVNEEMLTDIPFIESEIRNEGIENLRITIDEQLLSGDGIGSNLKGILEYAGGYALPSLDDSTLDANVYDAILAAHTMLNTLNFMPSAVFVHPVTRYMMRTTKASDGTYIIPPSADTNAMNVDGLPVIAKNQIAPGYFLMGDMSKSHVRFYADINVRVGYNGDDFRYNRLTFLVEARLTHYIKDVEAGAFIYDSFAVVEAALEAPGI